MSGLAFTLAIVRPVLDRSGSGFLKELRANFRQTDLTAAVGRHDTAPIFDWLMSLFQLQGISDRVAFAYAAEHGNARWANVAAALAGHPACRLLHSYWTFSGCGYRKTARTCARPEHLRRCPVPDLPLRNGRLNQLAFSLFLFIRDVCGGDLIGWIDNRLAVADRPGEQDRATRMRQAVLEPLTNVHGVSNKVLSMALADLLLAADPDRERWVTTGASMVAIDTLVHNFFYRTGILSRCSAEHRYGDACYGPASCASIIQEMAQQIDARAYDPTYPTCFPRFVQQAIWRFCAQDQLNICNGNRINDDHRCQNRRCTLFKTCARISLRGS